MVLDQLEKRGSTDSVSGEDDEAIVAAGGVGKDNVPTALRLSPNAEGIFDDSDDDRRTTAQVNYCGGDLSLDALSRKA